MNGAKMLMTDNSKLIRKGKTLKDNKCDFYC